MKHYFTTLTKNKTNVFYCMSVSTDKVAISYPGKLRFE